MSGHHDTGAPPPSELFDRMNAARHFQSGMALLHLGTLGNYPVAVIAAVRDEVAMIRPPEWHRFPHGFTHIFAGCYALGYYSYLWAEVLAADGCRCFADAGTIDRATGDAFWAEVLTRGATRPAADSFRAFRARDPDLTALLVRHGLA